MFIWFISGMLDADEFALAMHLMNIKLDGTLKTNKSSLV